jgi:hypothetical protein
VSDVETYASNMPSPMTPKITSINPIAPAGTCQLVGFSSATGNPLLRRSHRLRSVQVSPISRMQPMATMPVEINSRMNHLSLVDSREIRTESTTGVDAVKRKDREMRWLLKFLASMCAKSGNLTRRRFEGLVRLWREQVNEICHDG